MDVPIRNQLRKCDGNGKKKELDGCKGKDVR